MTIKSKTAYITTDERKWASIYEAQKHTIRLILAKQIDCNPISSIGDSGCLIDSEDFFDWLTANPGIANLLQSYLNLRD